MYKISILAATFLGTSLVAGCNFTAESEEAAWASSHQALRVNVTSHVATGQNHAMTLRPNGTVWAWGDNYQGMLGDGTNIDRLSPVQVVGLTDVVSIWAGAYYSLAVRSNGTLWAWGENTKGQLGDGTIANRNTPVQVPGLTDVVAVAAGYAHTMAVRSDGTLWVWGDNSQGQLGDGTKVNKTTPTQLASLTGVVAIAAGGYHSLAVLSDGTVWAWGYNTDGQLGNGTTIGSTTPVQVQTSFGPLTGAVDVGAGQHYSLAVLSNGTVQAWGDNYSGQLGDGTTTDRYTAVPVQNLGNVVFVDGSTNGDYFTVALKSDTSVWAWGRNNAGQLGDGTSNCPVYGPTWSYSPVQVLNIGAATSVSASVLYSVAQESDGSTWFWGSNNNSMAGNGTTGGCAKTPQLVPGLP